MSQDKRSELNLEDLDRVAGGAKQNNSKNNGNQQNNQNGDNNNEIIQQNNVKNNSGPVKIGSPVVIKSGEKSTNNINIS